MITFELNFKPDSSTGAQPTQAQQNAMNLAASNWGNLFANTATIKLDVTSNNNPNSDTLMSAGSEIANDPNPGFGKTEVVRTKALTGVDLNDAAADGEVTVNWGINWELDINQTPNANEDEFDFYSTFYHEINHALGFSSAIGRDGDTFSDPFSQGNLASNQPGSWNALDQFLTDANGNSLINPSGLLDPATYQTLLTQGDSEEQKGLFFSGPKAVAANGGNLVGLYTPTIFEDGSSGNHLDDENSSLAGSMMLSATGAGPSARTLNNVEQAIFEDLGYSFASTTPTGVTAAVAWNTVTGVVSSFAIDTQTATSSLTSLGRTIEDRNWQLQTTGDLNGDGQRDVLLRNALVGQNLLWTMAPGGRSIASEALIGRDVPDVNWSIAGTGDMNGDGKVDIVWRNQAADQIVAWYMDGQGNISSEGLVGRGFGDNNWKIEAMADFNGDGKADILLRNGLSGQNLLWDMDGGNILAESSFGRDIPDVNWHIEGANDFDGNGTIDVLLRHRGVGQALLWSMADKNTIATEQLIANVPDGTSQLVF